MKFFPSNHRKRFLAFLLIFPIFISADNPKGLTQNQSSSNTEYNAGNSQSGVNYRRNNGQARYEQNYQNDNYNSSDACCENYDSYESNNECCDSFWDSIKVPVISVIGGIIGGIIGSEIIDHKGHHGDPGPQGPQGPGFTADTGQTLTFTLTSLFPASPAGTVVARPFVTGPNGTTIEGGTFIAPTGGGTINFPPIIVQNPFFGFYNFGLSITNTSATTLAGITLNGTLVAATRDNSLTNELTPLAGVSIAPGESQISSTFTYDSANVP